MKVSMGQIAINNRADRWSMVRVDGEWRLRRTPSTYLDYPQAWTGYVWPVAESDSEGEWRYEIRSRRDGAVLDSGTGNLREALRYVNQKN